MQTYLEKMYGCSVTNLLRIVCVNKTIISYESSVHVCDF